MANSNINSTAQRDAQLFLNAASGNPDRTEKGGIPDKISGASTVRNQKNTIQLVNSFGGGGNFDIVIVVWNFFGQAILKGYRCTTTPGPNFLIINKNLVQRDTWPDGSPATLQAGGTCAYFMDPGKTPFYDPQNPGTWDKPLGTIQLNPDPEMLSGQVRVVGMNTKIEATSPEVLFQGVITQGTSPTYQSNNLYMDDSITMSPFKVQQFPQPPSGVDQLLKTLGAVQRPAYDGAFQPSIMNHSQNTPELLQSCTNWYAGPNPVGNAIDYLWRHWADPMLYSFNTNEFISSDDILPIHNEMNYMFVSGLAAGNTMQLTTSVTIEQFPDSTNSLLLAYSSKSPANNEKVLSEYDSAARLSQQFWPASGNAMGDYARAFQQVARKVMKSVAIVGPTLGPQGLVASQYANMLNETLLAKTKGQRMVNQAKRELKVDRIQRRMQAKQAARSQQSSAGTSTGSRPRTKPPGQQAKAISQKGSTK